MTVSARLRRQYDLERALADRIRAAPREGRDAVAAAAYDEFMAAYGSRRPASDAAMGATPNKERFLARALRGREAVLEIGCGSGRTLRAIAPGHARLCGLDVSARAIGAAREAGGGARFVTCSAVRFDFSAEPYDAAFSVDLVEHLVPEDLPLHLESVMRSLRDGGIYIAMTPHAAAGPHDVSRRFSREPAGLHMREYSFAALGRAAREAGFAVRAFPFPFRLANRLPCALAVRTVPLAPKVAAERILGAVPRSALRMALFKASGLHTVCLRMEKPQRP